MSIPFLNALDCKIGEVKVGYKLPLGFRPLSEYWVPSDAALGLPFGYVGIVIRPIFVTKNQRKTSDKRRYNLPFPNTLEEKDRFTLINLRRSPRKPLNLDGETFVNRLPRRKKK
jgi:hypothetical protein